MQKRYPNALLLLEADNFYLAFDKTADILIKDFHLPAVERVFNNQKVNQSGFFINSLELYLKPLTKYGQVAIMTELKKPKQCIYGK